MAPFGCLCMYVVFLAEIYTLTIIVWWRSAYIRSYLFLSDCMRDKSTIPVSETLHYISLTVHCMIKSLSLQECNTHCGYIYVCVVVCTRVHVWVWEQMWHYARMWPLFCWRTTSAHQTPAQSQGHSSSSVTASFVACSISRTLQPTNIFKGLSTISTIRLPHTLGILSCQDDCHSL